MKISASLICGTAVAFALASPAAAETADSDSAAASSDIIVTAQRRAERMQDVPITITSLSADVLEQANVQQLKDIVKLTPAVRFDYQAAFVQPSIRGVGNAVVTAGGGSNVGIYMDGFYIPNTLSGDFQLLNVEGVQVLKGPQGTLFGRNTTGGAILVTTSKPDAETHAVAEVSYGRFDSLGAKAYVTTGLAEGVSFDIAANYNSGNSWFTNIHPDGPRHPGNFKNWSVRAGLNVDLSENVSFLLRYTHQDLDDPGNLTATVFKKGAFVYSVNTAYGPNDIATGYRQVSIPSNQQNQFRFKSDIFQLTGDFDLGFADLTSYTQYRKENTLIGEDQDQTALPLSYNYIPVQNRTFTQELLLASKPGGPLHWTTGVFYFQNLDKYEYFMPCATAVKATCTSQSEPFARTRTLAAYADVTYEVVDNLFVTGGLRYSRDEFYDAAIKVPGPNGQPVSAFPYDDLKNSTITPRAVVRYQLDDRSSVYASYARGYKAAVTDVVAHLVNFYSGGAYNLSGKVKPEKMDAFEVGYKLASAGFSLNLAGWYYDYTNLQVSFYPIGLSAINNASKARVYGIEGETRYEVLPGLDLSASAAYVKAEYKDFTDAYSFVRDPASGIWAAAPGYDASGKVMQRSPKFTASLGARYGFDVGGGKASLSSNVYHTSSFYFDGAHQFKQGSYDLVGLRAEWTDASDRYTVAVYGDNVTGEKYYSQAIPHSPAVSAIWAAPATWGVSLKARY